MTAILLRGGYVVDPGTRTEGVFDVLTVDGKIASTGPSGRVLAPDASAIVDVQSCWVVPGLIDVHVHLRDPGFPQKETIASGLRAAAAGGFTTVAAMANTRPVNDSPQVTGYMLERARTTHSAQLVPVAAVTRGLEGRAGVDYRAMSEAGARLFSDDGMPVDDEPLLTRALDEISALGYAVSLHEEDRSLSGNGAVNAGTAAKRLGLKGYPNAAEAKRVQRDLRLAVATRAPVHIAHVSTRESLELVREARCQGAQVTCEVTPHHFALDEAATLRWGPNAKMNPPLRAPGEVEALRAAIADGTIDMIASDHAPHEAAAKHLEQLADFFSPNRDAPALPPRVAELFADCANGVVGLETSLGLALQLVHRSLIGAARLVEMMSLNPARLLRLERGTLATGAVADITVVDPNLDWTVQPDRFRSKSRNTPFMGMRLKGRAILTMVGGEIVYDGRRGDA
ncbi:MAG TPA: dihydroorotase [Candidatus Binataceae bacterium]|nr:dihydroorotase [Candidatus Binataceae bacterium]